MKLNGDGDLEIINKLRYIKTLVVLLQNTFYDDEFTNLTAKRQKTSQVSRYASTKLTQIHNYFVFLEIHNQRIKLIILFKNMNIVHYLEIITLLYPEMTM